MRPGVKVQLPGTTITLRPTSTVALAPKPGVTMATTATTTAQAARLIAPGQVPTPKGRGPVINVFVGSRQINVVPVLE